MKYIGYYEPWQLGDPKPGDAQYQPRYAIRVFSSIDKAIRFYISLYPKLPREEDKARVYFAMNSLRNRDATIVQNYLSDQELAKQPRKSCTPDQFEQIKQQNKQAAEKCGKTVESISKSTIHVLICRHFSNLHQKADSKIREMDLFLPMDYKAARIPLTVKKNIPSLARSIHSGLTFLSGFHQRAGKRSSCNQFQKITFVR